MYRISALALFMSVGAAAGAPGFSFTGNFSQDTDQREAFFTLAAPGNVLLRTFSYAGGVNSAGTGIPRGGFDPTLSLFDSTGRLLVSNEDGGCGLVSPDSVTGMCWDAYISATLPAGNYRVVLTQSTNTANGPALQDGFNGIVTPNPNPGVLPAGFWDESRNQRTPAYAFDISGATSATAPSFNTAPVLPGATVGQVYPALTFSIQPAGIYTWSVVAGTLPPGLALDANAGTLSGTVTAPGTYIFTIQAFDGVQAVQQSFALTASSSSQPPPALTILTTTLPFGTVGQAYGPFTASGTGGSGNYSWTAANLPAGLIISTGGQIAGVPTTFGLFSSIILTLTDVQTGNNVSAGPLSMTILNSTLTITSSGTSGEIALGSSVATLFKASGGVLPYTWSSSNLPAGLTLNPSTGALTGTPVQPGSFAFNIIATDSQTPANTFSFSFTLQVFGLATPSTLPNATAGTQYSQTLAAAGGKAPYTFSSPNLPPGLSLSGSTLTGTPTSAGTFVFTLQVTDANGFVATSLETLVVTGSGALTVSGGTLASGTVSLAYSQSLASTGGVAPLLWTLVSGPLPGGLSLATNGVISGTPYKSGTFSFTVRVTDSTSSTASAVFTIVIAPQPLTISSLTVPAGIVGSDYPLQIFTGTGGTAPYTFSFTGNLPPGLTLANGQLSGIPTASGTYSILLTITDSGSPALSVTSSLQIVINPSSTDLILSDVSVSFALTQAAAGLPASQNITVRSSNAQQQLNYSVVATPPAAWLDLSGAGTVTPGTFSLALDVSATALPASTTPLTTAVVVTCLAPSPCAGKAQTIHVSLLVTSPSPQLVFTSSLVEFAAVASSTAPLSQTVGLQNVGGGSALITSLTEADSWLTVTGIPSSVSGGPSTTLTFVANPSSLGVGFYRTVVTAASPAGSVSIPVTLSITQSPTLLLSTKGAQYQSILGSSPGNVHGSFQIGTTSSASIGWTAAVQPGSPWLSLTTASGSVSSSNPQTIAYTIDRGSASALAPSGTYYGTIVVAASGAANSPQTFQVVLNVAPQTSLSIPDPEPSGLVFTVAAGAAAPASQSVIIYSSSTAATSYATSAATVTGGAWLTVTPNIGTSSTSNPGLSAISVNPGTLAAGVYHGTVSYQFSAAAVRTVNVTLIVQSATSCTPKLLVPTFTGLASNFSAPVALPTPVSVRILQDCGASVGTAQVTATFSNNDPPLVLNLVDAPSGLYSGTWTPQTASPQVTVTASATATLFPAGSAQVSGQTSADADPLLTPGGAVHIYDPLLGGAVAPGTILSIFGSNLAPQPITNTGASLPTTLATTSVTIGGILAPLYYVSPTQINVQVPLELVPGDSYEVIVTTAGASTTAGTIHIVAAAPGIASFSNGLIIAQHLDYSLVTSASPAKPGEYIVFYLAGLGPTDVSIPDGVPAPSNPLAHPLISPTLTLNGASVPVAFAGLTPGFVGLYQMNFQVPSNAPNGNLTLIVSQAGVPSNTTTIPVHN